MNLFTPILVTGSDARTYLQGQLTCDLDKLSRNNPLLACCNSAQGRVQAVMTVSERDEGIVLLVVTSMTERTIERLRKYVLRSKVKIEDAALRVSEQDFAVGWPVNDLTDRDVGNASDVGNNQWPCNTANPDIHVGLLDHIRAGIPHIFPETHEQFVAQMLNLDVLGGISFEKGCYTGQEIIARAHFRGGVKRRMFRFAADCTAPAPGTRLLVNKEHAGDVVYAAATGQGCELLAVVNLAQHSAAIALDTENSPTLQRLSLPYSF